MHTVRFDTGDTNTHNRDALQCERNFLDLTLLNDSRNLLGRFESGSARRAVVHGIFVSLVKLLENKCGPFMFGGVPFSLSGT